MERLLTMLQSRLEVTLLLRYQRQVAMGLGVLGIEANRFTKAGDGLSIPALPLEDDPEIAMEFSRLWFVAQSLLEARQCRVELPDIPPGIAQIPQGFWKDWLQ